jgi:hypothetical protein
MLKIYLILICSAISSFLSAGCFHPAVYNNKYDHAMYEDMEQFGFEYAAKHNLQLKLVGDSTRACCAPFCLLLNSSQTMTLDQGRQLASELAVQFINMLKSTKSIKAYLRYSRSFLGPGHQELKPEMVGFRIDFWDKNIDRIMPPYLGQILFEESNVYYFEADPETLRLKEVYRQSFDEAKAFYDKSLSCSNEKLDDPVAQ